MSKEDVPILSNFKEMRSLSRWDFHSFVYESVDKFLDEKVLRKGIYTIVVEGIPIDIFIDIAPGQPLLAMFNGAQRRGKEIKLPVFSGFNAVPKSKFTRVFVSDPSLYLDEELGLAWYAGSMQLRLQVLLPQILKHIALIGETSSFVFGGGSGGAFASLYYSSVFPGSLSIASNPQTNILNYFDGLATRYTKAAFGLASIEEARKTLDNYIEFDLCKVYQSHRNNYIIYLQNPTDNYHIKSHCRPFFKSLGHSLTRDELVTRKVDDKLFFQSKAWGQGHTGPKAPYWNALLSNIVNYSDNWSDLFEAEEINDCIQKSLLAVEQSK